ncbi:MAG: immunoglobulin-like domain-containing protein [Cocleimonas sp.]
MSKSVKFVKIVSPIALAIALSACGGGDTTFGNNPGNTPDQEEVTLASSIEVSVSSLQLPSDGLTPVVISAIAKDLKNNAIKDAKIEFAVDNGATLVIDDTASAETTGAVGDIDVGGAITGPTIRSAKLTPNTPENRTLNVTVTSGTQSKVIQIKVVGTNVTIDGPSAITINKDTPFILKLKNSSNKAIPLEAVELSSTAGNTIITDSNYITNEAGEIPFTVSGTSAGTDTLKVKVLGVEYEKNISISGDEFALTEDKAGEIDINTNSTINFVWKKNGVPQVGETIRLSSTRGTLSSTSVVTDGSGKASFTITAATAGRTVISAITADGLTTTLAREFVATTPSYLNTQAAPTLIPPDGTSTIIAKVRDDRDNPVKNMTIDFSLDDTVDGTLSGSTAITDSLGRASVSYKAGNSSSSKDGVTIRTFIQGHPEVATDTIRLTVGGSAVRIVLGDDEIVAEDEVFYIKKFGVIASDSAGNPISDQEISFTIFPTEYLKGSLWYSKIDDRWYQTPIFDGDIIVNGATAICPSEDINHNNNLDRGEDINRNGFLDPTQDAAVTGAGVTDENGRITVEVVYPQNTAWWSEQRIEATTTVNGTEYLEQTDFVLPVAAADVLGEGTPPNVVSPYGTFGGCTDNPKGIPPVLPIKLAVINPVLGGEVVSLFNDVWYSITGDEKVIPSIEYTLSSDKVNIEFGPNNSFRLNDIDKEVDNSGFYINLDYAGEVTQLFYRDLPSSDDTVGPVISITGFSSVDVAQNQSYTDAGATAVDETDNIVTVEVIAGLPVDTATLGAHVITYRATDSSGNATVATRLVNVVIDNTPPQIRLNGLPTVTVIQNQLYADAGATALDDLDRDVTVRVISGLPLNTSTVGTYTIVYEASDDSGNSSTATRTVQVVLP